MAKALERKDFYLKDRVGFHGGEIYQMRSFKVHDFFLVFQIEVPARCLKVIKSEVLSVPGNKVPFKAVFLHHSLFFFRAQPQST